MILFAHRMIRIAALLLLPLCLAITMLQAQPLQAEWKKESGQSAVQDTVTRKPVTAGTKWSFGINGGYGYRLFRAGRITTAANEKYIKNMKSGIAYGGNVSYYPWRKVGFGVRYERYQSQADIENQISEDVMIQHLSGLLTYRSPLKTHKTVVLTSLLLGYQPYQNKTTVGEESFEFRGKTMGWGVSVGLEHKLGEKLYLNLTGTAMMGAIYRLQRDTEFSSATLHLSKDDSVDLSRFSLTLGFGFLK